VRALITGGAGFIGSHLAAQLLARGMKVRVIDNFRTGHRRNLANLEIELIEGSILDESLVQQTMDGIDYVFHLAALISVPESVCQPRACVELNVVGLLNVLEAAAAAHVKKLCFASSAAVYGDNPEVPKIEVMRPEPRSPYAITKLDGEYYCRQFTESSRLETVALRFFNVFGPRQDPASAYAAAVPIFMRQALAHQPLTIYGDGGQTRDFIFVKDIAAANIFAAITPGLTGTYNAGYGGRITVLELAHRIIRLAESRSEIRYAAERAGDVRHSRAGVDALYAAGFQPVSSFDAGLAETMDYFRKQQSIPLDKL
jgi:UDP-glucose 4-epimerase